MSLETKIDQLVGVIESLTEQVANLTEQVEKQNKLVGEALSNAKTAASEEKPAKEVSKKRAPARKTPASKKKTAPKVPTIEDIRNTFGPYLAAGKDKEMKRRLIDTVRPILDHFGIDKITEVEEDQRAECVKFGKMLADALAEGGIEEAEDVVLPFSEDQDVEEDDGLL